MIVVIGSPLVGSIEAGRQAPGSGPTGARAASAAPDRSHAPAAAAGLANGIARAAAAAGSEVEVVGKVGTDPGGDAVLLDLAAHGIGHVAVLRDPTRPTPVADPAPAEEAAPFDDPDESRGESSAAGAAGSSTSATGLSLDPADIDLALRYLPDYRVVVVAELLPEPSLRVVVAAVGWSEAALVIIVPAGSPQPPEADDSTVIEAPQDDPDDAFAGIVGAYAAAIDRGEEPAKAFAAASSTLGWATVAD